MKYGRTFNFSAGPAMMPEPVLEEIRDEMMNYRGSGMCVMEMSHRSKVFQQIADEAQADLRKLMNIPDNYKVLFIQGGGTLQFAMVAMNLMKNGKACYVETGAWSKKAIAEAKKYGEVQVVASSADKNFSYIPDCSDLDIPEDADYVYICENETINGTTWNKLPNTKGHILVSDQSSMFLSRPCNVSDYGLIWAGVQKNVGPAGMAVVIIREDLIRDDLDPKTPIYMKYKTHADNDSMYNTPNCWAIYCCGKVFKYLLRSMARCRWLPPPPTRTSPISPTAPIWTSPRMPTMSTSARTRPSTAPPGISSPTPRATFWCPTSPPCSCPGPATCPTTV